MKIYINKPSPYVRRALIAAHEKNLVDRLELTPIDPWSDPAELHDQNPIGRLPTLIMDDGRPMVESLVIMQFFNEIGDGTDLAGNDRVDALRRAGLNQGIIDSSYAAVIENRRPEGAKWDELVERQTRVIERTVKAAQVSGGFDYGDITLVAALGYLSFRLPDIDWKGQRPDLASWMADLAARPSVALTAPDAP
ncbi:MAG: glutathione S-transferase family protein [Rhodospirillales bacterium]|nr:glutathione S-transferase family protein [Rhodospirillales bacterium]MBO6785879.1 glutathione S-transferase family protein [Rhodospirillales bacterium]